MDTQNLIDEIQKLVDFEKMRIQEIDNNIITENGAEEFCDYIDYTVESSFNYIFGNEHNLEKPKSPIDRFESVNDNGILTEFDYINDKNCKFAVMVSYWNYVRLNGNERTDDKRKNSFYKGQRWSVINDRKDFYSFFNLLRKSLGSENVPVSFLVNTFIGKSRFVRIIAVDSLNKALSAAIEQDAVNQRCTLYFPILIPTNADNNNHAKTNLNSFLNLINNYKDQRDRKTFNRDELNSIEIVGEIEKLLPNVIKECLEGADNELKTYILNLKNNIESITDKVCEEENLLKMLLLYQYYDVPYTMHFFLPKQIPNQIREYCCIAFSTPIEYTFSHDHISSWEDYVDIIERLLDMRRNIWDKISSNILKVTNDWETAYNENFEKYQRLSSVAKNIFKAVCAKVPKDKCEEIDVYQITDRVKEFQSFFNKIINRANNKDNDFPDENDPINDDLFKNSEFDKFIEEKRKVPQDHDRIKELREKLIAHYRNMVLNPSRNNIDSILSSTKDIIGVRIVCKFQMDVNFLHDIFKNSNESKSTIHEIKKFGLIRISFKEALVKRGNSVNEMGYYYTSNHYYFKLSEHRKSLIEFDDICDIPFELQVRTTLSQGISDISHELYYKPKLPEGKKEEFKSSIKNRIQKYSWDIKDSDDEFSKLKYEYIEKGGRK